MADRQTPEEPRRVSKACDACRLRKVKCNGQQRCQQCNHLNLKCIYSAAKVRKNGQRGSVISGYRNSRQNAPSSSQPLKPAITPSTTPSTSNLTGSPEDGFSDPVSSPGESFEAAFFLELLPDYQASVYPVNPIITDMEARESILRMHTDMEHCAFAYAFAAVTMNLTKTGPDTSPDVTKQVYDLCRRAVELRGPILPNERITTRRIMLSMFVHNCLMTLQHIDMAFFYIREAITMILMLRVDDDTTMSKLTATERARRQRLYWLAFVHERFLAIGEHRPVVLSPLSALPEFDSSIPIIIHEGFAQIIKLFSLVDGGFLSNWLSLQSPSDSSLSSTWIEDMHKRLDNEEESSETTAFLTDMQQADLIITRQWLRMLVWQMAMSKCLLSSFSQKECMSLLFPVRLSSRVRAVISTMSREAIEIHGSGILQKLFELTDTIADVIIHVPAATLQETFNRVDDFLFLLRFLFTFPRFSAVQKSLLQKKLEQLQQLFPYIAGPGEGVAIPPAAVSPGTNYTSAENMSPQQPWLHMARSILPQGPISPPMSVPEIIKTQHQGMSDGLGANVGTGGIGGGLQVPDGQGQFQDEMWQLMTRRLSAAGQEMWFE
ncbi:hypothetical protein H2201_006235 [Coniosporium apollinis]|uniref:Zn(2)-C6 fungal-type domain-containing protein n=2 Tax=Coniosporium TaxID=2810619 RepID=A0ABQ9NRQ0_9PEZI|nr:hypothetical protein H2199_007931 [Cladosporium sp. JES 115]KAJ9662127.1 hypothetical protein H2201_006235 [Coniosporium apollinis]